MVLKSKRGEAWETNIAVVVCIMLSKGLDIRKRLGIIWCRTPMQCTSCVLIGYCACTYITPAFIYSVFEECLALEILGGSAVSASFAALQWCLKNMASIVISAPWTGIA